MELSARSPASFGKRPTAEPFELAPAPERAEAAAVGGSLGMMMMPAASGAGAVVLAVSSRGRPLMAVLAVVVLVASIAVGLVMVIGARSGARRRTRQVRERYLDHVEVVRRQAREAAAQQHVRATRAHPDPRTAGWATRPHRTPSPGMVPAGFRPLRVGVGTVPLHRPVRMISDGQEKLRDRDGVCVSAAADVLAQYRTLPNQPVTVHLSAALPVVIRGPSERVRSAARALLAQLVTSHHPDDLAVLICSADDAAWSWAKWLPHCVSRVARDGPLPARLLVDQPDEVVRLLAGETERNSVTTTAPRRSVVVLLDHLGDNRFPAAAVEAAAHSARAPVIHLTDGTDIGVAAQQRIAVTDAAVDGAPSATVSVRGGDGPAVSDDIHCLLDQLSIVEARMLARRWASRDLLGAGAGDGARTAAAGVGSTAERDRSAHVDVADLDVAVAWRQRSLREDLCAPLGTADDGSVVTLDLKEAAHGGVGPHGLIVGATGSGKSELLRTLITGLAIGHPPERLAFLMADFKGGATFAPLATLPHVAGMVTNLDADAARIDRFRDALAGEVQGRQELFAAAGVTSLDSYAGIRTHRTDLRALPRLLVIVDEFSELLGSRPDLAELFAGIGRVGRSIGMYLLLATQRLDTGRIRGLESHLSYRLCLRTFSEAESREAIGSADAFRLPREPGWAYLVTAGDERRRFRAATVSRPYRPSAAVHRSALPPVALPFDACNGVAERFRDLGRPVPRRPVTVDADPFGGRYQASPGRTVLTVAVERLRAGAAELPTGHPVRPIWLPPLPDRLALSTLLRSDSDTSRNGATSAPLALVDIPERQRQDVLRWDGTNGNGNVLIVGAGRSGKSTALAALALSIAARHSPTEIGLLGVDLDAGHGRFVADLPHTAAVASRSDPDLVRRVLAQLSACIAQRAPVTPAGAPATQTAYRNGDAIPLSAAGRVLLLLDGWMGAHGTDPAADDQLEKILTRGPAVGVHVALTAVSPTQLRGRLLAGFSSRIELRLADPFDSVHDRKLAGTLRADQPGRAVVDGRHLAQIAVPTLGPDAGEPSAGPTPSDTVESIRDRWPGQSVRRIATLPRTVTLADIQDGHPDSPGPGIVLGLADDDLMPVRHDLLGEHPHLMIYGEGRSGKTTALRTVLSQVAGAAGSASAPGAASAATPEVMVIDYRRHVLGSDTGPPGRVATDPHAAAELCAELSRELAVRLESARPSARGELERRDRPEVYLAVDDLDLVVTPPAHPLHYVMPFLALGRDLGFHLLVARRTGGIARAQFEPLLQTLNDLATPLLLLSGSPTEGRIGHGLVPMPLPPGRAQWATRSGHRLLQVAVPAG